MIKVFVKCYLQIEKVVFEFVTWNCCHYNRINFLGLRHWSRIDVMIMDWKLKLLEGYIFIVDLNEWFRCKTFSQLSGLVFHVIFICIGFKIMHDLFVYNFSKVGSNQIVIDEKLDEIKHAKIMISRVVSQRDMATQMSSEGSSNHSSPWERFCFVTPLSLSFLFLLWRIMTILLNWTSWKCR